MKVFKLSRGDNFVVFQRSEHVGQFIDRLPENKAVALTVEEMSPEAYQAIPARSDLVDCLMFEGEGRW